MRFMTCDPLALLRALPRVLPSGAEIWMEASCATATSLRMLSEYMTKRGPPAGMPRGTLFPRERVYGYCLHQRFADTLVQALRSLPAPEVCSHLHVYGGASWELSWCDVGSGADVIVHDGAGERVVAEILAILGPDADVRTV